MKVRDFSESYSRAKNDFRDIIKQISYGHVIANVLKETLTPEWMVETDNWRGDLRIRPKSGTLSLDQFDKLLKKLSKTFGVEPRISINDIYAHASLVLYRQCEFGANRQDWSISVRIEIEATNTEKCEVTYKRKMQKVAVLSGYCKALSERKYLEAQKR